MCLIPPPPQKKGVCTRNEMIQILDNQIQVKEWAGQRVITFQDIDTVHQRPRGTASRNFRENRDKFIDGVDYFILNQPDEIRCVGITRPQGGVFDKVTLLTESGYLMIVKSLHDDLAWAVQRELVNTYFKAKEYAAQVEETTVSLVNHETILRAAAIMATCPDSTRYVVNLLRNIDPNIDNPSTVTVQVADEPVEIPHLPAPETAVVKTTKTRKPPEYSYFNYKKFRRVFGEQRWTVKGLAEAIGSQPDTVSNWKNGHSVPRAASRDRLCEAMDKRRGYFDK